MVVSSLGIDKRVYRDWKREGPVQPRRVNNLSVLMIERGQFSAVYFFIFFDKKYENQEDDFT